MSLTCNSLRLAALPALALLAACGDASDADDTAGSAANIADAVTSAASAPPSEPGRVVHTIAPAARDHAGLVALLDADAARGRAVMEAAAKGSQAARGWRKDWRVTARTTTHGRPTGSAPESAPSHQFRAFSCHGEASSWA